MMRNVKLPEGMVLVFEPSLRGRGEPGGVRGNFKLESRIARIRELETRIKKLEKKGA